MELYLAEQYWPDVTSRQVLAALDGLSVDGDDTEVPARIVAVLFTPDDECVFYLVEGDSEPDAAVLVARTGRPADRVQRCQRLDRGPLRGGAVRPAGLGPPGGDRPGRGGSALVERGPSVAS